MKKIFVLTGFSLLLLLTGCEKFLVEDPKSTLTPEYFKTTKGFRAGLDAAYGNNRLLWGNQDLFTITVIGTDEFFTGIDGNNNINKYNSGYTPSIGQLSAIWRVSYAGINTCNGIVDNAPTIVGIDEATKNLMVAEAKFLRANYYFVLVQFWGDVTLNKNFDGNPGISSTRAPMADVYDFIIQDINDAMPLLPVTGALPGKATRAAAMHLLSKVYLTRGWSSAKQAGDFTSAHTIAIDLINNVGPASGLGLLNDFDEIHNEGNEGNKEVIWTVQHTANLAYNGPNNSGGADNVLNHMWVPQYENQPGMKRDVLYGRPYIRCVPTRWLTDTLFAERVNDTRYRKTFQTVWFSNNEASIPKWTAPLPPGAPANAVVGQPKFTVGDTAIYMPGVNVTDAKIKATRYLLMPPRNYTIRISPAMNKYFDTKRADLNYPSIRPVIVWRLAETYLIAAEALLMDGQPAAAVPYVNAIRRRAAYPTGNAAAMDVTAAAINIDFILDERSRELCGENLRWWDLVRTGKLLERVKKHNNECRPNIVNKHILRPIPQAQIDAVAASGVPYPQNPGW